MQTAFDTTTPFGARAERRLREDRIGWLTTVRGDGTPVPIPVWFLWQGDTFLLYSQPGTPKLRHIEARPRVSLHLDGDGEGGDIIVVLGEARVAPEEPPADRVPAYLEKYASGIERIGMTAETFAASYSVPLRMSLLELRGH